MKRQTWVWGVLLVACFAGGAIWFSRPRTLLDMAAPVADSGKNNGQVLWLSADEFILYFGGNTYKYKAQYTNLRTGVKTRLPGLETALASFNKGGIVPSPDGKRLLCIPFDGEPEAVVLAVNGKQLEKREVEGNMALAWLPDSKQWIDARSEWSNQDSASHLKEVRIAEVGKRGWKSTAPVVGKTTGTEGAAWESIVVTQDNRLMVVDTVQDAMGNTALALRAAVYNITATAVVPDVTYTIRLPVPARHATHCVSPDGKRIAWCAITGQGSAWSRLIGRLFPRLNAQSTSVVTLYVADLDSAHIRELGSVRVTDIWREFRSLQWLPGSRKLSFFCQGRLWTVPAG